MLRPRFSSQLLQTFRTSLTFPRSFSQMTTFDERWNKLTQAEKDLVAKEYEHLQKGDWKSLTIDQKRIRNPIIIKELHSN